MTQLVTLEGDAQSMCGQFCPRHVRPFDGDGFELQGDVITERGRESVSVPVKIDSIRLANGSVIRGNFRPSSIVSDGAGTVTLSGQMEPDVELHGFALASLFKGFNFKLPQIHLPSLPTFKLPSINPAGAISKFTQNQIKSLSAGASQLGQTAGQLAVLPQTLAASAASSLITSASSSLGQAAGGLVQSATGALGNVLRPALSPLGQQSSTQSAGQQMQQQIAQDAGQQQQQQQGEWQQDPQSGMYYNAAGQWYDPASGSIYDPQAQQWSQPTQQQTGEQQQYASDPNEAYA